MRMCDRMAVAVLTRRRVLNWAQCVSLGRKSVLRKVRRSNLRPTEKAILAREWKRGASKRYICKILNIADNTLVKQRVRLKLPARKKEPTKNTFYVGFYVTPELDRAIKIFAHNQGLTKSDWLRRVVQLQLKG